MDFPALLPQAQALAAEDAQYDGLLADLHAECATGCMGSRAEDLATRIVAQLDDRGDRNRSEAAWDLIDEIADAS